MTDQSPDAGILSNLSVRLGVGITGHRSNHAVYAANQAEIAHALQSLFELIDAKSKALAARVAPAVISPVRLHSLLAYGADLMAVQQAQELGWTISAPLPFGRALNVAINAQPGNVDDLRALLAGNPGNDELVAARALEIERAASHVNLFELAEQDAHMLELFEAHLAHPGVAGAALAFQVPSSDRAAMAARVMIEQSDVVVGIWDGVTRGSVGGTRHTISASLDQGVPVIWINASRPDEWSILRATEELAARATRTGEEREADLDQLVRSALLPDGTEWRDVSRAELWRAKSNPWLHAYRRIEAVFGDPHNRPLRRLTQRYERPEDIAQGSGAAILAAASGLPGCDPSLAGKIADKVLRPFAWADGVSTWLSDAYRGGMVASFFLSAFAIVGGTAYLPFADVDRKWLFALFEFILLAMIIAIFFIGKKWRWHERWFETRRVAEYFRHAPILLLLGAARSTGRWPRGAEGNWPEWYVRHELRSIGLPKMKVTAPFLRASLALMRDQHVVSQRNYHRGKATRLRKAQRNLDGLSEILFVLAVISVAIYLLVELGTLMHLFPHDLPHAIAKTFTFLGVLFPTMGGAFAGVHYFGDFERFASISDITAEKLDGIATRISILLAAHDDEITYARVSDIAHGIDDIVVSEIESWQAVFGGKHITVPV